MSEELRQLYEPLTMHDILLFLQEIVGSRYITEKDIEKICLHTAGFQQLDVKLMISYCKALGLIDTDNHVKLNEETAKVIENQETLNDLIVSKSVDMLFESTVFYPEMFRYDEKLGKYCFENQKFPTSLAPWRNTLQSQGFFIAEHDTNTTKFVVAKKHEGLLEAYCERVRKKLRIEDLKRKLEEDAAAGEKAEHFVLEFEKRRINNEKLIPEIKIISNIDVTAGYDIVSFNNDDSHCYDRFIEVKAVNNQQSFFWSNNEAEVAKVKKDKYYLYLIELARINDTTYAPAIIKNPAFVIFESSDWMMEAQTYHVWHVCCD